MLSPSSFEKVWEIIVVYSILSLLTQFFKSIKNQFGFRKIYSGRHVLWILTHFLPVTRLTSFLGRYNKKEAPFFTKTDFWKSRSPPPVFSSQKYRDWAPLFVSPPKFCVKTLCFWLVSTNDLQTISSISSSSTSPPLQSRWTKQLNPVFFYRVTEKSPGKRSTNGDGH